MDVIAHERSGVLVLRIWTEAGQRDGIRARITTESDLRAEARTSVVAGSVDEVVELVRRWVLKFIGDQQPDGVNHDRLP